MTRMKVKMIKESKLINFPLLQGIAGAPGAPGKPGNPGVGVGY
jgi:hypothetical protein